MDRERKIKYIRKMSIICATIVVLVFLYRRYEEDIYLYGCDNEGTKASCAVVGILNEQKGKYERALYYYEKSCELEYNLGCNRLALLEHKMGKVDKARASLEKACKLGHKLSCKKKF